MTELLLRESEQAAVRAVIASEPVPGSTLPGESVLPHLARLIASDAIGITLLNNAGLALVESAVSAARTMNDCLPPSAGPLLGIHQTHSTPAPGGTLPARRIAVLSFGVRRAPDDIVRLWMVRRTKTFSGRDRALLALVSPALERLMRERSTPALPQSLTLQERRVLRNVAAGLSNSEIAERLFVAPCTVRKHLENAYRKLGVTNRLAAVVAIGGGHPVGASPTR